MILSDTIYKNTKATILYKKCIWLFILPKNMCLRGNLNLYKKYVYIVKISILYKNYFMKRIHFLKTIYWSHFGRNWEEIVFLKKKYLYNIKIIIFSENFKFFFWLLITFKNHELVRKYFEYFEYKQRNYKNLSLIIFVSIYTCPEKIIFGPNNMFI